MWSKEFSEIKDFHIVNILLASKYSKMPSVITYRTGHMPD